MKGEGGHYCVNRIKCLDLGQSLDWLLLLLYLEYGVRLWRRWSWNEWNTCLPERSLLKLTVVRCQAKTRIPSS